MKVEAPATPYFNSTNFMTTAELRDAGFQSTRWGGNATSKYKHKRDLSSSGPTGSSSTRFGQARRHARKEKGYYHVHSHSARCWGGRERSPSPSSRGSRSLHLRMALVLCSFPRRAIRSKIGLAAEKCGDGLKPGGNAGALLYAPHCSESSCRKSSAWPRCGRSRAKRASASMPTSCTATTTAAGAASAGPSCPPRRPTRICSSMPRATARE